MQKQKSMIKTKSVVGGSGDVTVGTTTGTSGSQLKVAKVKTRNLAVNDLAQIGVRASKSNANKS